MAHKFKKGDVVRVTPGAVEQNLHNNGVRYEQLLIVKGPLGIHGQYDVTNLDGSPAIFIYDFEAERDEFMTSAYRTSRTEAKRATRAAQKKKWGA